MMLKGSSEPEPHWNSMREIKKVLGFPNDPEFMRQWLAFWQSLTSEEISRYRTAKIQELELDLFILPKPPSPFGE